MLAAVVIGIVIGLVVGAAAGGAGAAWLASARAVRVQAAERGAAAAAAAQAEARRADLQAEATTLRTEVARLEVLLEQERRAGGDREEAWEDARRRLTGEFAGLARQALSHNTEQFLALADARLQEARQAAAGDLDQRRQSIEQTLAPLREQLTRYEDHLRLLELDRQRAYSGLSEQVRQLATSHDRLQAETRNLVTALRAPATRGRWGELQLRRVVEMAGMVEHCDFDEQVTTASDGARLRPDLVVRLPGDKQVVVDAKVPLQAFLDANDATDEVARRTQLAAHARHLRAHVDALAKKGYWEQFPSSPEFVVAFVPGDPLLAAALEQDPGLLEHAASRNVLFATPTTLIALLRTVAYGWQQDSLADSAREVQQMGRELYRRLATFGEHLARTGRGLAGAVESYNRAVGSLERNVLPQARRFHDLGLVGAGEKDLTLLEPLDVVTRRLQAPELASGGEVVPLPIERAEPDDLPTAGEG